MMSFSRGTLGLSVPGYPEAAISHNMGSDELMGSNIACLPVCFVLPWSKY